MKVITISMDLVIDDTDMFYPEINKDKVCDYLNNKLYTDPEFFGDFGPENITNVCEID